MNQYQSPPPQQPQQPQYPQQQYPQQQYPQQPPPQQQYYSNLPQQYYSPPPLPKDPNTAFLLEFVGGIFCFMGFGYMYAGRSQDGLIRLLLWLIAINVAWIGAWVLASVLVGFLCMPVILIAQIGIPYWSADTLKREMMMGTPPPMPPMPPQPLM
jgi:hypothetical protein